MALNREARLSTKAKAADLKPVPRPTRARRAGRKIDDVPGTITHRKLAEKLGITPETLRKWVGKGTFPRPHAVIETIWLYREDHVRAFLETGKWPEGMEFNRRRGGDSDEG